MNFERENMKKIFLRRSFIIVAIIVMVVSDYDKLFSFGWYAHRKINRMAVFTLPPDMISFFKKNIEYITEHSVDPDKRTSAVEGEAAKHYMDLERYGPVDSIPMYWREAVARYTEDTLKVHGILPYNIYTMYFRLKEAFKKENLDDVLYNAANIGHYIGDACTPLHNTKFYNGRISTERGIHGFWETRLPELLGEKFDYFVGRAEYIDKPQLFAWQLVKSSHAAVDTIYRTWDEMAINFPADKMFVFETKGQALVKQYSADYSNMFNEKINSMVERQMRRAVHAVASIWYTAWVDAGQPDLKRLEDKEISEARKKESKELDDMWRTGKPKGRANPVESEQ